MKHILITVLFLFLFISNVCFGDTYYVCDLDTDCNAGAGSGWSTGNDSNSAAQAQNKATPWKTIQKAADNMVAGDTVIVGDGTYTDDGDADTAVFQTGDTGTSDDWITYKAENKWGAVLSGENRQAPTAFFAIQIMPSDHYIRIEDFDMTFMNYAVSVNSENHDIYFYGNRIHQIGESDYDEGTAQNGIYCGAGTSGITIDSNWFEDIGKDTPITSNDHAVYLGGGLGGASGASDILIKNNIFVNGTHGFCIHIYNGYDNLFENINIINNTFHKPNTDWNGQILLAATIDNCLIQNNIFLDPNTNAIHMPAITECFELTNITMLNNMTDVSLLVNANLAACEHTRTDNQTSTDPLLTDPDNGDYTLQVTSVSAIDAGTATGAPSTDYDQNPRPQGADFDIGAYEYPSNSTSFFSSFSGNYQ